MDSENSTVSVTSSVTRLRNASFVVVPHAQFLSAYPSSLFTLYENCEVIALSSACDRALLEPLLPDVHRLHSAWLFAECPAVDVVKEVLAEKVLAEKEVLAEKVLAEKVLAEKVLAEKVLAEKEVLAEKVLAEKVLAEKVLAEKVLAEKVLAEKVLAEKVLAEKVLAEKETLTQTKTITDVKNTRIIEGWKHHERIPIACEANTFVSMLLRVSARVLSKT